MRRILVCEDEDVIRDFVVINLNRAGYDVVDVNCGEDALRVFDEENGNFDIALLDIMMPGIDGWDIIKAIREKYSKEQMSIIVTSAITDYGTITECQNIGVDDFITKPIMPDLLLNSIQLNALKFI